MKHLLLACVFFTNLLFAEAFAPFFDPFAGLFESTVAVPNPFFASSVTNQDVVKLYRELLGRDPEPAGLIGWVNSGLSYSNIRSQIAHSEEAKSRIQQFYQDYLGRLGSPQEVGGWLDALQDNGLNRVQANILASPEARARRGEGPALFSGNRTHYLVAYRCREFFGMCELSCGDPQCVQDCYLGMKNHLHCAGFGE